MKKWNDLFSEGPSEKHEQDVLNKAEAELSKLREKNEIGEKSYQPSWLERFLLSSLGLGVTGVFAVIFWKKKQVQFIQDLSLADLVDEEADIDDLMDEDLDLDLLAELDEFEELDSSGVLDKEIEDERS